MPLGKYVVACIVGEANLVFLFRAIGKAYHWFKEAGKYYYRTESDTGEGCWWFWKLRELYVDIGKCRSHEDSWEKISDKQWNPNIRDRTYSKSIRMFSLNFEEDGWLNIKVRIEHEVWLASELINSEAVIEDSCYWELVQWTRTLGLRSVVRLDRNFVELKTREAFSFQVYNMRESNKEAMNLETYEFHDWE